MSKKQTEAKPRLDYRFIELEKLRVGDEIQFEFNGELNTGKVHKQPSISHVTVMLPKDITIIVQRDNFRGVLLSKYQYRDRCKTVE